MNVTVYGVTITGAIIGLVEVAKKLGLQERYCPLLCIVLGIAAGIIYTGTDIKEGVLVGIAMGLSSCGLYSGVKNTIQKRCK